MNLFIKDAVKSLYYAGKTTRLREDIKLKIGYIFHTEELDNDATFTRLIEFIKLFRAETGKAPICAVMTGANERIRRRLKASGFADEEYARRIHCVGEKATLGYHGHFWREPQSENLLAQEMRQGAAGASLADQLTSDLNWFKRYGIDHQGVYAAGWWYMCREIQRLLVKNGFHYDFSTSYSPHFYNEYSSSLLQKNRIEPGQAFDVHFNDGSLRCIQNFIGCHRSRFPEDFIRNMNQIFSRNTREAIGVVNSHDYDLDLKNTMNCIRFLRKNKMADFIGFDDFCTLDQSQVRSLRESNLP
jgi:hypothetical protein